MANIEGNSLYITPDVDSTPESDVYGNNSYRAHRELGSAWLRFAYSVSQPPSGLNICFARALVVEHA